MIKSLPEDGVERCRGHYLHSKKNGYVNMHESAHPHHSRYLLAALARDSTTHYLLSSVHSVALTFTDLEKTSIGLLLLSGIL